VSNVTGRIAATDLAKLIPRSDDPPAEAGKVLIYIRMVDDFVTGPQLRTLARFASGTIIIIL
jgi:hypothetical protein